MVGASMRRLLIVAALVLAAAAPAVAAPGALDPTFGNGGLAALGSGSQVFGEAMAIADDGKILVAGSAGNEMAVARFLPDGAPDPTFDDDGFAFIDPSPGVDAAYDIAALRNGRSVVVGLGQAGATANDTAIVLLDDHGHPDPAFNGSGKRVIDTSMSAHGDEA